MKFKLAAYFMAIFAFSKAQTITITNGTNGEPLEFVTISSLNPTLSTITDLDGKADISAFKGVEKIEIRLLGFEPKKTSYEKLKAKNYSLKLDESYFSLDDVVISATKWEESSAKVPSKIISISKKEAQLQNPQTAADLLGVSGKVFIQKSQQGGGSPMIRGFATNRLLYTVDGVRMNTAIFRGGNVQNVINLDAFATENVEVLFGPGSVMYGSDAIGGVMQFQTLRPTLSQNDKVFVKGNTSARFSSANQEKTGHFDINVGWKKWAMVSSVTYSDYNHLRQGSKGPDEYVKPYYVTRIDSQDVVVTQDDPLLQRPTAYSQLNLMQKLKFQATEHLSFDYGFHYSITSPYGRYDRHNRMRNNLPRYAVWDYGPQKWMMNQFAVSYDKANIAFDKLKINLAHQLFEESRIERSFNRNDLTTQIEKVNAYSANIDFYKEVGPSHELSYGVEYVYNNVNSTGTITDISDNSVVNGPPRYPESGWHSIGVFINDVYKVHEKVTLQAGLRYNHILLNSTFDTTYYPFPFTEARINKGSVTGSFGAVYRPMDDFIIQANFGTAFRSPNVDDIGKVFDSEPGAVTVPNPDLTAEYAYNVDAGIAKIFANRVKIDVTAYYTFLQNALVRRNFTLNDQDSIVYDGALSQVQAIQNAAKAYVWGIQAGLEIKLPANFTLSTDFNYQKGIEGQDDGTTSPSRHAAPWFGNARLKYQYKDLVLEFYSLYSGGYFHDQLPIGEQGKTEIYASDDIGRSYSPGWYTFNFKANYQFHKNFGISAGVENLADARYRTYSSGVSAPGRNFIIALNAKF